jgi:sulfoxide reductase heme-binding subunit YedZ
MTDALWYLGRGTGVVSLLLLTLVVALGIATRSGRPLVGLPRFAVGALHRNAGLLAVLLLGIHVGTLLADPYAQLRLVDLAVPFAGRYRAFWLGLGTLGLDLIVALIATSQLRHRLGTGTDAGRGWLRAIVVLCVGAVLGCVGWRLSAGFGARSDRDLALPSIVERPATGTPPSRPRVGVR